MVLTSRAVPAPLAAPLTALGALALLASLALQTAPLQAQVPDLPDAVAEPGIRTSDIRIDGRIQEPAWQAAPLISGFIASEPTEGEAAAQDTHVRILFDDDAIYVSAHLWEANQDDVRDLLQRRDQRGAYFDWFGVSMDPNHDRRTGYAFRVNAAGVQQDLYMFDDTGEDTTWDAVWESAVTVDSLGWHVELRIPLSQIRYESGEGPQTWGLNLHRRRVAAAELSHFSLESRRRTGLVSQFGVLENVRVPATMRRIEARPYVLSSLHRGFADPADPFFDGNEEGARVGADFRLGLGSAFTLDATVNPDFGQVEADPAEINLTAFETFFNERRPFFVEDAQVFDFQLSGGQNQLLYSRRIGHAPQGRAPSGADVADIPDAATILGAAKLTGRTSNGLSVGAMAALTQAETGRAYASATDSFDDFVVEPRTGFGALTARKDLRDGELQVGGIATAVTRDLPGGGEFDFLPEQAFTAGVQFENLWDDRQWRLNGFFAGSHVRGRPEAMVRLQRASNHYFQRPDGTGAPVDSSATSLSGSEWRLQLDRQNTPHWIGAVWFAEVTRGFEINDIGFSRSSERLDGGFRAGYREIQPGRLFRTYSVTFNTIYNFSHEALNDAGSWQSWQRAYTGGSFSLDSRFTFLNLHGGSVNLSWRPDQYSRSAMRGGPIMIQPGALTMRLGINSDRRRNLSVNGGLSYDRASRDSGDRVSVNARMSFRPTNQFSMQFSPTFSVQSDRSQYVSSTSTLAFDPTYGRRYLFGELDRKTLTVVTRADYTFSPTLSLQLYTQALISAGNYVGFKQLNLPSTYDFRTFHEGTAVRVGGVVACSAGSMCLDADGTRHLDFDGDGFADYGFNDPNFNVRSLLGNAVLRWEYRPGSAVLFVWQRQQRGDASSGDFDFGQDFQALWGAPAENRFILKVNYWLGM